MKSSAIESINQEDFVDMSNFVPIAKEKVNNDSYDEISINVSNKNPLRKSFARLIAVQTFYQYDFCDRESDAVSIMNDLIEYYVKEEYNVKYKDNNYNYKKIINISFLKKLVACSFIVIDSLDNIIIPFLKVGHSKNSIPEVLMQVLRLATFELKFAKNIPVNVIINEYVDIVSCYYDDKRIKFANGILNSIAKSIRGE